MAIFETFTYKGKDYKFRVGKTMPKIEPPIKYGADYYKDKQKSLSWVLWLTFLPVIVLGGIYFAYVDSDEPGAALEWLASLAFLYGMIIYIIFEKIGEASEVLSELQKRAEGEEYLDAYKAWMKSKQDDSLGT